MDEQERAASNRRMLIILGGGAALAVLALALVFAVGKSVGAPLRDFDADGIARAAGEGMKQVGKRGEKEAAKVSVGDEG